MDMDSTGSVTALAVTVAVLFVQGSLVVYLRRIQGT